MDYINAFWVGGLICALVQILLDKTKLLPGRVMVILVCTGAVLGSVGIYEKLMDFAGAGASVPLLGIRQPSLERCKKGHRRAGIHRNLHGRLYLQCRRNLRSPDLRLSRQHYF